MNMNICPECGIENEEKFIYCKNCGAQLAAPEIRVQQEYVQQPVQPETAFNTAEQPASFKREDDAEIPAEQGFKAGHEGEEKPFEGNAFSFVEGAPAGDTGYYSSDMGSQPFADMIDGIPAGEVGVFIGKKTDSVLPKFRKMEITGSKVSWCWPVAVLSFFFGPIGAALWFLYRKMYKMGIILLAIGVLISSSVTVISELSGNNAEVMGGMEALFEDYIESPPKSGEAFSSFFGEYAELASQLNTSGEALDQAASIAAMVICGIFAFYWYKEFAVKKIYEYRSRGADIRYYQFGLMSLGGTSAGAVIIGIIASSAAVGIIDSLISLII